MSEIDATNLFNVKGLVAVITGGGSGLGQMMAKAFDENGAKAVYITGRRREPLDATAKLGKNGSIKPVVGDVTSKKSLEEIAARVQSEQGFVNVVVANAGIATPAGARPNLPEDRRPTIKEIKDEMWKPEMEAFSQVSHVNSTAVLYTALAFLELLDAGNQKGNVEQKSQIIVISSIAGLSRIVKAGFAYSASKAASIHLAKTLATYLLPYQIRVNTIAPGLYPSELTQAQFDKVGKNVLEEGSIPADRVPLTRVGREEDFAGIILFLVGRSGMYINGQVYTTDGGRLAMGMC